ncbi:hypothetical protein D9615_007689 [Tricholomella constricta]|uniref:Uncharacterized protein n=1 Tax=Tricholomella constricta TaxID=117010 RepID=A0A8H5H3H2_9AGAR|nr:hypothetical protein D9615_007689 [Tricholomella constricta]
MQHTFRTHSRPIKSAKFVDCLLRETRQPIWRLITALNTPQSVDLPAALSRHGVSVDHFRHWRPLIVQSNLSTVVDIMQRNGLVVNPSQSSYNLKYHIPSWLVLYLIAFKIRTHDNAFPVALDLAYSHLPVAPIPVQAPLLIFTLLGLARFNLVVPMHRLVDTFLLTNLDHPQLYFNLLLQALACTPTRTVDTANTVVTILRRMDARQLKLTPTTYDALLNDRFVTLQLTKYLRERMTRERTVPTAAHLEAYLRVFSRSGAIHKAHDYLHAIRRHSEPATDVAADPLHRANTLFLAAQDDRASAFNFLRKLLASSESSDAPVPSPKPPPPPPPPPKPKRPRTPALPRAHSDIYTYTSALAVAARDHTLSSSDLLALFKRAQSPTTTSNALRLAPTTATHTVLIRGLLQRKSFDLALKAWDGLYESGLPLDREALAVGLQTLTRAGMPHRAFALLEGFAGPAASPTAGQARQPLTIVTLNDWLVALNRIARPDVVFALWDALPALYGVHPDARTLSIVLQSARLARRLDEESVAGAMVRLKLEIARPFRGMDLDLDGDVDADSPPADPHQAPPQPTIDTRAPHHARLLTLLGPSTSRTPHPYKPALWHGTLPWEHALLVFQQALFGAAPDPHRLLATPAPAQALMKSAGDAPEPSFGPFGLLVGLPPWRARGVQPARVPALDVLLRRRRASHSYTHAHAHARADAQAHAHPPHTKGLNAGPGGGGGGDGEWTSRFPTVAPTNETCFNCILLLGLVGRAGEVARVLAWMREVGIRPGRQTLGAAVVLWREVAGRAVLVERWTGTGMGGGKLSLGKVEVDGEVAGEGKEKMEKERRRQALGAWAEQEYASTGEYGKLMAWLADWVGVWRLPGPRALTVWSRNIARLREGGRDVGEGEEAVEKAVGEGQADADADAEDEGDDEGEPEEAGKVPS